MPGKRLFTHLEQEDQLCCMFCTLYTYQRLQTTEKCNPKTKFKQHIFTANDQSLLLSLMESINHWGHTARSALPHPPFNTSPGDHPVQVSMQAPFPYQVTPNRKHRLASATNFVGAPLASSTLGYPIQRQPDKQGHLLGSTPHAHKAGVDVGRLCW